MATATFSSKSRIDGDVFLDSGSAILSKALGDRLLQGKREAVDLNISDFDRTRFKLVVVRERPNECVLSVSLPKAWPALEQNGAYERLEELFPGCRTEPAAGFDAAVFVDLDNPPVSPPDELLKRLVEIKTHLLGAPLRALLVALTMPTPPSPPPVLEVPWRPNESVWLAPQADRCTAVFSLAFDDEMDAAVARSMAQQFASAQRKVNGAPPCAFSPPDAPPLEVRSIVDPDKASLLVGYVSFTVFKAHVDTEARLDNAVAMLVGFRNYLHYHIKGTKTYLHMRMRRKVNSWLQVLNRAVQREEREKTTVSGKRFVRK